MVVKMFTEHTFDILGFKIAAKSFGPKNGRPVLCLHGMLDNAASFDFLAPLIPDAYLLAIDFPGTGLSSAYPEGCMPMWKNDTLLLLRLAEELSWPSFDIIAHSLGSLTATMMAISRPVVKSTVSLDILGPKINYQKNLVEYRKKEMALLLGKTKIEPTIFKDKEEAIKDRMKIGRIAHKSVEALVERGVKSAPNGVFWDVDHRLRCVAVTLPHEDEIMSMYQALDIPVLFVRAQDGVTYDPQLLKVRRSAIKNLTTVEIDGGHHVHMDAPEPVAKAISKFWAEN